LTIDYLEHDQKLFIVTSNQQRNAFKFWLHIS
jgi:hypothetical protein